MNKLAILRRFTLSLVFVLAGVILWGQTKTDLAGSGTELDPYLIESDDDWTDIFAIEANAAKYWASGIVTRLDTDITVSTMVGTSSNKYRGTFDGNWHTLTLAISSSSENAAPFSYINGANIKNLKIEGSVTTSSKYAGSIIGSAYGNNTITSCTSTATITISTNGDASTGGLAGRVLENGGVLSFYNCSFEGSITGSNAEKCAGFVGWVAGTVGYTNCLMAGTISISTNTSTFNRQANNASVSTDNAFYITRYNGSGSTYTFQGPEGTIAPTALPTTVIGKKYTKDATDYYVPGAALISGLGTTSYSYTGNDIVITPSLTYYGWTMTENTHYEISYEKKNGETWESATVINAAGDYRIIISGAGNYAGSYTSPTIHVVSYNTWADVKNILADDSEGDRNITLSAEITADVTDANNTALVVKGSVILNLNGHTINRALVHVNDKHEIVEDYGPDYNGAGQVIIIESGASLTINGSGTITGGFHKGDATYIDGGGIYNSGTLVLNNVSVVGNKVIKRTDGTYEQNNFSGRGGGIYSGNSGSLIITDGEIADNEAIGGGGGIYCDRSYPFNMTGVMIKSNISEDKGGGIRVVVSNGKTTNLTNCNFINNCATVNTESKGGGIYYDGQSSNSTLNLVNDTFTANSSFLLGGAIYLHRGTITATNCDMNNNVSFSDEALFTDEDSYGGAVCLYSNSTYIMDGGSITGDMSKTNGGGIYIYPNAVLKVMGNVIITNNTQMDFDEEMELISSNNNVYLADATSGVIQVIGELGPDAVISIANSEPGTYIAVADGVSYEHILEHIALDNNENRMIIDKNGEVQVYAPYPWKNADTWDGTIATIIEGSYPPTTANDVIINRAVKIPSESVAYAKDITFGTYGSIIIEDGGQLINNNSVAVVAKKEVVAADAEAKSGWYLISSPVTSPNITSATNLITPVVDARYDLYRFNEAAELQWENYKAHSSTDFTTLENGRGYLYRNEHKHIVDISGDVDVASSVTYTLSYTETVGGYDNIFKGFNIIGNPYSHNIAKGEGQAIPNDYLEENYYVLNTSTGEFDITDDGTIIPPMTGILVQATSASTLTISKIVATESKGAKSINNNEIWFTINNSEFEDRACVKFKEGHGLNKIEHLNEDAPMLYIHHNGEDFASVDMNPEVKQFNLNFEAKTMGFYTLSVKLQGEYSYLHLIDKLADKDIDLLIENEYTFVGSASDSKDRFVVRLSESLGNDDKEVFAYQSGNEIIVSGEGELQIFDVMGRMVATQYVDGVGTWHAASTQTGVYILKLNGMTQKIVVR